MYTRASMIDLITNEIKATYFNIKQAELTLKNLQSRYEEVLHYLETKYSELHQAERKLDM